MTAFRMKPKPKANKYGATKTADGFPSKLERSVYFKLQERERLGLIKDIKRQQTVVLQPGGRDRRIALKVDFSFIDERGELAYAEAKGFETKDYRVKLKLWRANPPATLEIWKGHYLNPKLTERITKQEERNV